MYFVHDDNKKRLAIENTYKIHEGLRVICFGLSTECFGFSEEELNLMAFDPV